MISETLKGRDYISTFDWTTDELETLLAVADELKEKKKRGEPHHLCQDKTVFLIFFDKSTRTRNAFEAGITQLGGHAHYIDAETSQIAHGEHPRDTGIILSSYGHAIAIRHDLIPGEGNRYMRDIARWADKPVINLQCDIDHPTQTIADLMTMREIFGANLRGLKMAVSWAYTPAYAKPLSVPQGLLLLMPRFGIDLVLAYPPEFNLMPDVIKQAQQIAQENNTTIEFTDSMNDAFKDADIVYPKSWGVLELFGKPQEALKLAKKYQSWQCNSERMKLTREHSIYMHCLPADRGNEVTDEVIDGPRSVVFQEAENRLHTAKAIMALTM